jgi:hypothetical protein
MGTGKQSGNNKKTFVPPAVELLAFSAVQLPKKPHYSLKIFLTTNQMLAGRSARRRMK